MKKLLTGILIATFAVGCDDENFPLSNRCGAQGIVVYSNTVFSELFGTGPVRLVSGEVNSAIQWGNKMLWLLSNARFQEEGAAFRNCVVVWEDAGLNVVFTIPDPDPAHFFRINQAQIHGDTLELIVSRWVNASSGRAGAIHEESMLVSVSMSDWQSKTTIPIVAPHEYMFGSAIVADGPYTYVYATRNAFWNKEAAIARVSGSWFNAWEYFNGSGWVKSGEELKPVLSGVSDFFSVFKDNDRFYAVSFGALLSQELQLWEAHLPGEGWRLKKTLYCSQPAPGVLNSDAVVVAYSDDLLTCSYNRINGSVVDFENLHPVFIDIFHWRD